MIRGKKETCDGELKNTTLNVSTKYRIIKNKNIKFHQLKG